MKLQISSGSGPAECELAVGKLLQALMEEFPDIEILDKKAGRKGGCFRSVQISSETDLSFLEGTVLWICKSPYRPHHGRKNWFVDISVCQSAAVVDFDDDSVRYETFRSGGKGGQHVNKVETGVRAIHIPTGISVVSSDERSQSMNKRTALKRLHEAVESLNTLREASVKSENRLEHTRIERGNPVRVYKGIEFRMEWKE